MNWAMALYIRSVERFLRWLSPGPDPWDVWDDEEDL